MDDSVPLKSYKTEHTPDIMLSDIEEPGDLATRRVFTRKSVSLRTVFIFPRMQVFVGVILGVTLTTVAAAIMAILIYLYGTPLVQGN